MAKTRNARGVAVRWAIDLPLERADLAGRLPASCQAEVAVVDNVVWLRGLHYVSDAAQVLTLIPGASTWLCDEANRLTRLGNLVPERTLPHAIWRPLSSEIRFRLPEANSYFPGPISYTELTVTRCFREQTGNLLVCSWEEMLNYAECAPQWRLESTRFAANDRWQAAVVGLPLPPLPGELFCESQGIAVAAGWAVSPHLDASVLRRSFGLASRDIVLIRPKELTEDRSSLSWERIAAEQWLRTDRVSIRRTNEAYHAR